MPIVATIMKNTNKLLLSPIYLGINLGLLFAFTSCDSSDGDGDNVTGSNVIVTPPADPTNTSASANNGGNDNSAANVANQATFINEVTTGVNTERNSNDGLSPLIRDNNLDAIAAAHNIAMRDSAPNNADPIQINHNNFQNRGNQTFALGYTRFGENVAGIRNYATAQVVPAFVNGWINSPGHAANILGDFTHTGIDILVNPTDGTIYATQVFAK